MTKLCNSCEYLKFCARSGIEGRGCDRYKKDMTTNEEWFCSLSTEEKADWLDKVAENCCQICDEENRELCRGNIAIGCKFESKQAWESWLKAVHKE